MKKGILLSLLIFTSTFFSFAQRDKYRVYIKAEVKGRPGISYKINFQGDEVDADELERAYSSNPDPMVRVRYYNRFGIKLYDYITRFSNTSCVKERQEFTVSGSDSYIYFQLIAPALGAPTGPSSFFEGQSGTFSTSGPTKTNYIWEVSRDLVSWKQIDLTSTTSYNLKSDKLHTLFPGASAKYGDYYLRVKPDDDCVADRISDPSSVFILRPPVPTGAPKENPCDGDAFVLTADLPGNVEWQVSEKGGPWQLFEQTTGNTVTVTLDKITKTAPRYNTSRSIRYKSVGKSDQYTSAEIPGITYYEPRPVITGIYTEPASCAGANDGKIIITGVSGGTSLVDVEVQGSKNKNDWNKTVPLIINNVSSGINSVQLVNTDGGCPSTTLFISVGVKPDLEITSVKSTPSTCIDQADGTITASVQNGTGSYHYVLNQKQGTTWVKVQESSYSSSSSYIFTNLLKGEYQIVVDDNCKTKIQSVVVEYPVFTTTQTITPQYCNLPNGKVELTSISGGKPPYTLQWNKGSETGPIVNSTKNGGQIVESLVADTYYLYITDANGCRSPALSIKVPTQKAFTFTWETEPSGCGLSKGEARVKIENGFAPYTYTWFSNKGNILRTFTTFSDRDTLKLLKADSYRLTVQDGKGCIVTSTFGISERPPVIAKVTSTTPVSCRDGRDGKMKISVSGGKPPYTYLWNDLNKQTTAEAVNLSTGDYEVKVTDAIGCVFILPVKVPYLASVYVESFITPPTCFETCDGKISVMLSYGTPPYQIQWSTGEKDITEIQNLCRGKYTLTVKDGNNCISTFSFNVNPPEQLLNPLKEDTLILCKGQTVYLDAGAAWENYYWKNGYNTISNERYLKINQAATYSLEVRNEQGCQALDTIRVFTSDHLLKAKVAIHSPVVVGDTLLLTEFSNPIPDSCQWIYSSSDIMKIRDFSPPCDQVVQFRKPGNYQVTFTAYLGECRDSLSRVITVLPEGNALTQLGVVNKNTIIKKASLYPNPNQGAFMMELELDQEEQIQLSIYGLQIGDKLWEFTSTQSSDLHKVPIQLQTLPPGMYVVLIQIPTQGSQLVKFIIE